MTRGRLNLSNLMDPRELKALVDRIKAEEQMSEEDFIVHCLSDMMNGWVPLVLYLRMFPDESANKVHKRVQQGGWKRQVHYAAPDGGGAWVNLPAIRLWLEGRLEEAVALEEAKKSATDNDAGAL